jgi:hypothetical protein
MNATARFHDPLRIYGDALLRVLLWEQSDAGRTLHVDYPTPGVCRVTLEAHDREYVGRGATFLDALEACRAEGWPV